jgi:hypothetical protein
MCGGCEGCGGVRDVGVVGFVGSVGSVGSVGCGGCGGDGGVGGVGSLLTFDISQTALVATLDTYDFKNIFLFKSPENVPPQFFCTLY